MTENLWWSAAKERATERATGGSPPFKRVGSGVSEMREAAGVSESRASGDSGGKLRAQAPPSGSVSVRADGGGRVGGRRSSCAGDTAREREGGAGPGVAPPSRSRAISPAQLLLLPATLPPPSARTLTEPAHSFQPSSPTPLSTSTLLPPLASFHLLGMSPPQVVRSFAAPHHKLSGMTTARAWMLTSPGPVVDDSQGRACDLLDVTLPNQLEHATLHEIASQIVTKIPLERRSK